MDSISHKKRRLMTWAFQDIEMDIIRNRKLWFNENYTKSFPNPNSSNSILRQAYDIFFNDFLNVNKSEIEILSEIPSRISFASKNQCTTLEACAQLNLDTRKICKNLYEKSTQFFFSQLDPRIRFGRSYSKIRPHHPYCEEWLYYLDFESFMKIAIDEANISLQEGNKGYGAVVVFDGKLVSAAHDATVTYRDPSLHAEMNAIKNAFNALNTPDLTGAILFTTCEPCSMCTSLAVWANITTIVYGASIPATIELGKSRIGIRAEEIAKSAPTFLEVIGGVLEKECLELYR